MEENTPESKGLVSRKDFIKNTALTAAAFTIVPRHVLGKGYVAPSDKLYIACVGCGGPRGTGAFSLCRVAVYDL